jgi:hypothetical protein
VQLAKEPRGCLAIPVGLEQNVDDFAVLIDGPPEVLTLATNRHKEFVQMPRVAYSPGTMPERRAYARPKSRTSAGWIRPRR